MCCYAGLARGHARCHDNDCCHVCYHDCCHDHASLCNSCFRCIMTGCGHACCHAHIYMGRASDRDLVENEVTRALSASDKVGRHARRTHITVVVLRISQAFSAVVLHVPSSNFPLLSVPPCPLSLQTSPHTLGVIFQKLEIMLICRTGPFAIAGSLCGLPVYSRTQPGYQGFQPRQQDLGVWFGDMFPHHALQTLVYCVLIVQYTIVARRLGASLCVRRG